MKKHPFRVPGELSMAEIAQSMKKPFWKSTGAAIICGISIALSLPLFAAYYVDVKQKQKPIEQKPQPHIEQPNNWMDTSVCVNGITTRDDVKCGRGQAIKHWYSHYSKNNELTTCSCKQMPPTPDTCVEHSILRNNLKEGDTLCEPGQFLFVSDFYITCGCTP